MERYKLHIRQHCGLVNQHDTLMQLYFLVATRATTCCTAQSKVCQPKGTIRQFLSAESIRLMSAKSIKYVKVSRHGLSLLSLTLCISRAIFSAQGSTSHSCCEASCAVSPAASLSAEVCAACP